jgi:hypothetical protein
MSRLTSHFSPNTPSSVTSTASHDEPVDDSVQYTKDIASGSISSTQAGPSVWRTPARIEKEYDAQVGQKRKTQTARILATEDDELDLEVSSRFV